MKNFRSFSLFLMLICLAGTVSGQSNGAGKNSPPAATPVVEVNDLDRGVLDGLNYLNDFFGLSLSVPESWIVVSAQRREAIGDDAKKVLTGDEKKRGQIADSIERSVTLLALTKLSVGEPGNASFMLVAERIPLPSIKTATDVINTMKGAMRGTNFSVEPLSEIQTENIGGGEFSLVTFKNSSPKGTFMQKIYVTTKNGYALELFYTYVDESDHAGFESIIKSIKIK